MVKNFLLNISKVSVSVILCLSWKVLSVEWPVFVCVTCSGSSLVVVCGVIRADCCSVTMTVFGVGSTTTFTFYSGSEWARLAALQVGSNWVLFWICILIIRWINWWIDVEWKFRCIRTLINIGLLCCALSTYPMMNIIDIKCICLLLQYLHTL